MMSGVGNCWGHQDLGKPEPEPEGGRMVWWEAPGESAGKPVLSQSLGTAVCDLGQITGSLPFLVSSLEKNRGNFMGFF